ncbi:delta-latroinsectotoxin-Lt1a-like [Parasteatoda tepidariorum]|uniref:delta-latroinsectotoxin-Lt1a-like n=1 Tax=Parasteatoda tepidariorum TaxID=114398 RepID=UPI001C71C16F|nr:delta-latroinsectotoxin-Lt1a-like [Parasteatoda tepidariorum]
MPADNLTITSYRTKRETDDEEYEKALEENEEKKKFCKKLEYASKVTGLVGDLLGDLPDPTKVSSGLAMTTHLVQAGFEITSTALECDDVNFDEIKLIMAKRFSDIDKKIDAQTEALEEVSRKVSETLIKIDSLQSQMHRGFKIVIDTIENTKTQEIITKINTSAKYFEETRESLNKKHKKEYIDELSSKNSVLHTLESYSDPVDSLYSALSELINNRNNYAIPQNAEDNKAFQALFALFYGTQTYFLVKVFLMKQHAYIANYNYEIGNFDTFNKQYGLIKSLSTKFKSSLLSNAVRIIQQVKNKNFMSEVKNEWYKDISENILIDLKNDIEAIDLNLMDDVHRIVEVKDVDFSAPEITSQYGDWKDKREVSYAVQLRNKNKFSTFSSWSKPEAIGNKANPTITVEQDNDGRERLIFRKFDKGSTQFVGVVKKTETKFRDIDRDLYNAAGRGNQDLAYNETQLLIGKGADIDAVFEQGRTMIHAAALKGNSKVARDFFFGNIDVNSKDRKGHTPLHIAAESDQKEFIQELINQSADVNAQTKTNQFTPLHIAARSGFLETVRELMKSPIISVNTEDKFGFTALHHATHKKGNAKIVRELFTNNDTNISAKTKLGLTPLHLASINGFPSIVDALLKTSKLQDINETNEDGMTALHFAALYGKYFVVKKLLSKANIGINNVTIRNQWTPLHFAIYFKNENVASQLLSDERTQFNLAGGNGVTPLHLAIAAGQLRTAENLIKKGADKEAKIEDDGSTALHLSMKRSEADALVFLIQYEVNLNAQSNDGTTALHLACKYRKLNFLSFLLDADVNVKIVDNNGILAIQTAIDNMDTNFVKAIVEKNPSIVDPSTKEGVYLLQLIHEKIFRVMYQYIKNKSSPENEKKYYGLEPLEVFKQMGVNELCNIVLNPNNDPNENNDNYERFVKSLYDTVILPCIEKEKENTPCPYSAPLSSRFSRNIKFDVKQEYIEQVQPFSKIIPQAKVPNREDLNSFSLGPSMDRNSFSNSAKFYLQNFNTNNVLVLLDLVIRKFKKEKYSFSSELANSSSKSRALALNITEKFEKFIDTLGKIPTEERMNLAEISSKIYKSLERENDSKIVEILCSYVEEYLKAGEITNIISALPPDTSNFQKESLKNALHNLTTSCIADQV